MRWLDAQGGSSVTLRGEHEPPKNPLGTYYKFTATEVIVLPKLIDVCRTIPECASQHTQRTMETLRIEKPIRSYPIRRESQKAADECACSTTLLTVNDSLEEVCERSQLGRLPAGIGTKRRYAANVLVIVVDTQVSARCLRR
jgi:hypothetical protein